MKVLHVGVAPCGECPLGAPLSIELTFEAKHELKGASWGLQYVADIAHTRHVVPLSKTEAVDYVVGKHCAQVAAPDGIPVGSVSRGVLQNLGALEVSLTEASGTDVAAVRLITDVRHRGGEFLRVVLD
eukprot:CAMPEP_0175232182 /NCGR_PEP_ID=MMETSP0093-20121207/25832_1 /TAXON_ID=311494 /ORGANISM="Alexandrium monilatum, Strain CCMP3105" /LENGTH=127 /DNA_ID=CAMNT_0016526041 /DNA_START=21 /DNA_END=401 /DNA_ORIENTATION=+